ncbi:diaminopimelate decarboxylase [Candidatus Bathyarchaeota archaeon]|mgnify:CR=1 FL=1|nr:MAG: diaminopimelate decarboxylase [Candidatus Bathyarchaeota archaeon]
MKLSGVFENRNGVFYIDGVSSLELAEKYGTPLYVLSEKRIRENYRRLYKALSLNSKKFRIYYSAKANTNLSVLKILKDEGAYIDTVSPGEVFLALKAGFSPEKILFTGTSVKDEELNFLVKLNIPVNVDSLSQLKRLLKITTPEFLSFRVNPQVRAGHHQHCITAGKDSKFGFWENEVIDGYKIALKAGVKKFGIHMHIGSGILKVKPFVLAVKKLLTIIKRVYKETGITFNLINIGGGLGIPYKPGEKELNLNLFSSKVFGFLSRMVEKYGLGEPILCIEPGRYIVGDAGILLTRVNTVKSNPYRKFVGVDAGFNMLIRPVMYNSYHHIVVANKLNYPAKEIYDIVGPLCESGDFLARGRKLPKIEEGDLLAVMDAGAYGYVMSSQYNSRPRGAEVLVMDGKHELIREAETLESLLLGQKIASWLT